MDTPPAAEVDIEAARAMWAAYAAAHPGRLQACPEYTVEQFGDSRRLADELLTAVTDGTKRATSELLTEFRARGDDLPRIGSHWIACDGSGSPSVVLRSTELRIGTFDDVDARFAYDEGEDDRSLSSWQSEHRLYWQRACNARGTEWSEQDEIVLERFAVVWPPELAG